MVSLILGRTKLLKREVSSAENSRERTIRADEIAEREVSSAEKDERFDFVIKRNISSFEEAVEYIYDIPRFTKKNCMEDTKKFLRKLGSPDERLQIIHVAGTNGKGSVCSYMKSILEAAGKKVALFTSPHLVDIRERFVINKEMVSKEAFLEAFLAVYDCLDWDVLEMGRGYHPTYFEFLFFVGMILFERANPDYCILETGLGGRLDATNAVENKVLSVITRISLEHVEYLGNTITSIAGEKAGIMKAGVPVVFTDAEPEATGVFYKKAEELSVSAFPVSKSDYAFLNFKNKSIDFSCRSRYDEYIELHLHTIARYQMENCALAVRAIEVLDSERQISHEMIRRGVSGCFWAGRMEEVLPGVFVDGAHNEDGVRAFLETVAQSSKAGKKTLLFSVVADKDYEKMLKMIASSSLFDRILLAHLDSYRAAELSDMSRILHDIPGQCVEQYASVREAFDRVLDTKTVEEQVYIAGSLYLVGEIKEYVKR